jgi:hypothetical protein
MRRPLLIAAALAVALSGCGTAVQTSAGGKKFTAEQQDVVKVVSDLAAAGRARNAKKICDDILSQQLLTELKSAGGDCVAEMKSAIQDADDYDLRVDSVKVTGTNATAQVRQGKNGPVATFTFVKEKAGWRASALGS